MASSGGGSKGCNTCRRRKKGCDLNRPYCFRCMKEGRMCEGYERRTVFIMHKPDKSTGAVKLKQIRPRFESKGQPLRFNPTLEGIVLHSGLARSAFGEQCASFWWDAYIPKADAYSSHLVSSMPSSQRFWCSSWADTITRMSTNSTVLRKVLFALSLSCAGFQQGDEKFMREGQKYYGEALTELGQILQDPKSAVEDEALLPTCLQLADYEFFNGFSLPEHNHRPRKWQVHVEGINRLMRLRDEWKHNSTDALIVFQSYRKMQLSLSFGRQRACSPDCVKWSNIHEFDDDKAPKEQLRDLLMPVPGLLAEVGDSQISFFEEREQVLQGLIVVYQQLRQWKIRFAFSMFGANPCPDPAVLLALGIDAVDPCLLYWTACIAIYNTIEKLRAELPIDTSSPFSHNAIILPDEDASVGNILKFASFLLRLEAGLAGVTNVVLPIGMMVRYHNSKEELETLVNGLLDVVSVGPLGPILENLLRRMWCK